MNQPRKGPNRLKDFILEAALATGVAALLRGIQIRMLARKDASGTDLTQGGSVEVFPGVTPARKRSTLCLFASFSRSARIDAYVWYYLEALQAQLDCDLIFATTSRLAEIDRTRLRALCRHVLIRENIGIDFGSWKVALEHTPDWRLYDRLVIANDSVLGPLFPIDQILEPLQTETPLILGITESIQHEPHLQSYFVAFNRAALQLPFFEKFWTDLQFHRDKKVMIHKYEIGLTREARRAGCRVHAVFPFKKVRDLAQKLERETVPAQAYSRRSLNPTHYFWKTLLVHQRCPFLKTELVRDNPEGIREVETLKTILAELSIYPTQLLELSRPPGHSST